MSNEQPYRNPMAVTALLVSLVPLLTSLTMVALKLGVGPQTVLFYFAELTGFFHLGLVVIGSALAVVALTRTNGRHDLRIYAAFISCLISLLLLVLFAR